MSDSPTAELSELVSWEAFQHLPERPENGKRYELQDGMVVEVPLARPRHLFVQLRLVELLRRVEDGDLVVAQEFPYRPAPNYQFWFAGVAVLPRSVKNAMNEWTNYDVYAPPLVVEVLSSSNTQAKVSRQRVASMSNGTLEFWVVDADKRTVLVTSDSGVRLYRSGEAMPLTTTPGKAVDVAAIFEAR